MKLREIGRDERHDLGAFGFRFNRSFHHHAAGVGANLGSGDMTLIVPTVHLNGTSKQELLDQLCEAITALHAAGKALARACPNGRDYYVQSATAIGQALDQHEARMNKLREIVTELEAIAEAI